MLLEEPSAHQVGVRVGLDLIVFQATDRSINLQNRQRNILGAGDAMLAKGALKFIHADVLFRHVSYDDLTVMNQ